MMSRRLEIARSLTHATRAPMVWVRKFRPRERVVTLPDGRRARLHIDPSGTVRHVETDDGLSAVVTPRTIRLRMRSD